MVQFRFQQKLQEIRIGDAKWEYERVYIHHSGDLLVRTETTIVLDDKTLQPQEIWAFLDEWGQVNKAGS